MQVPDSFSRPLLEDVVEISSWSTAVSAQDHDLVQGDLGAGQDSICRCPGPRSRASCLVAAPLPNLPGTAQVSWLLLSTFCAHGQMSLPCAACTAKRSPRS